MRGFCRREKGKPAVSFTPILAGILLILLFTSTRLLPSAEWNLWTLQFSKYTVKPGSTHDYPSIIPEDQNQASIWLARDALTKGNAKVALDLIEPLAIQNNPFALRIQATALEEQGDFAGALQTLIRTQDYRLLIEFGANAAHANEQPIALTAYQAALEIEPEMGVAELVQYLSSEGDLLSAEAVLRSALDKYLESNQRLSWFHRLGSNLRKQERLGDAEIVYQAALDEYPNDLASHIRLGWVYYEQGDGFEKASEEFQQAIAIDPIIGDGYFAMASLFTREERYLDAAPWYDLAIEHDPQAWSYFLARANNARSGADINLALSLYTDAVIMFPDHSAVFYYEMALAFRLRGQANEAILSIEQALSLMNSPDDRYYVRAGEIYEWSGETSLALGAYQNALIINPDNRKAKQGVSRLSIP